MQFEPDGTPVVVVSRPGPAATARHFLARKLTTDWDYQPLPAQAGWILDFAVARDGRKHLLSLDPTTGDLLLYTQVTGEWRASIVAKFLVVRNQSFHLRLDSEGRPAILSGSPNDPVGYQIRLLRPGT